jgi:hypothetical protein
VNALLCRVGADRSRGGGSWNGLVDAQSGKFVYAAIPETRPVHAGMEKPYSALSPLVLNFGGALPLSRASLDPKLRQCRVRARNRC